jgi:RNA polymerase sigma-70 factor (ECF subfamily)
MTASDEPADRSREGGGVVDPRSEARLTAMLVRVAHGDDEAFAALYDTVAGRVLGLARRVTRNHALAEEVTQEVMVEVWRTAPRFDPQRVSAIGWILMLTHRRSVDRVRRSASQQAREARDAARRPVQEPVDGPLLADEERREVNNALGQLTDLQREAIELAYYDGHTYREVADVLGVPEGTAKSRLRDGLRQLRADLGGGR